MPSFYPRTMSGRAPLTPPEFIPGYEAHGCRTAQYPQDSFMTQQTLPQRLDSAVNYCNHYAPPSRSTQPAYQSASGYANSQNLPPISSYYEPMGAPLLPPLRVQDNYAADQDYRLRMQQSQQAPKEEKAVGGVSAKLDYEMDRMTDFVSEAAQGIIQPTMSVQPSFHKWVSQVLSATRLPSATILLSLHYLTVRMKEFPTTIGSSENSIYRLLAVSMILGSKFLDDNTFINRSWSDVSGIKVSELNMMEIEWLAMIGFDLHADPADPNGLAIWLRAWKEYDAHATAKARSLKLSPLDTNIQRQPSLRSDSSYQPGYTKTAYGTYTPLSSNSSFANTPFVSADPWNRPEPTAADYYASQNGYYDHTSRFGQNRHSASFSQPALPPLQSFAPSYYSPWNQTPRAGTHDYGCNCLMCTRPYNAYSMGSGYAPQTVMG